MQYSTSFLLAAAAATSASANVAIPAAVVPKRGPVQARQTDAPTSSSSGGDDGLDAACASAADVIETSMPTVPSDLLDYYDTYTYTDSCLVIPSSLKSEWDDYTTSLVSWSSANRDDLSTFLAGCTDYELDLISDYCTTDAAARGGSGGGSGTTASATPTSDDNADDAEETGPSSTKTSGDDGKSGGDKTTSGGDKTTSGGDKTTSGGDKATHTANVAVAREVGVAGAVVAGVLGMAVAL